MNRVDGEDWDWTIYEHEGALYLSVHCDGVASYDLDIPMSPEEIAVWEQQGREGIAKYAAKVRYDPHAFKSRRVTLPR